MVYGTTSHDAAQTGQVPINSEVAARCLTSPEPRSCECVRWGESDQRSAFNSSRSSRMFLARVELRRGTPQTADASRTRIGRLRRW
eukprot:6190836-Pleurochrysis_carterae.AAC.7